MGWREDEEERIRWDIEQEKARKKAYLKAEEEAMRKNIEKQYYEEMERKYWENMQRACQLPHIEGEDDKTQIDKT